MLFVSFFFRMVILKGIFVIRGLISDKKDTCHQGTRIRRHESKFTQTIRIMGTRGGGEKKMAARWDFQVDRDWAGRMQWSVSFIQKTK